MHFFVKFLQIWHLNSIFRAFLWDFGVEMEPQMRLSMVGASLRAAPSVRIAKSRQSSMAKQTKQTELLLLVGDVIHIGMTCRTMNDVIAN